MHSCNSYWQIIVSLHLKKMHLHIHQPLKILQRSLLMTSKRFIAVLINDMLMTVCQKYVSLIIWLIVCTYQRSSHMKAHRSQCSSCEEGIKGNQSAEQTSQVCNQKPPDEIVNLFGRLSNVKESRNQPKWCFITPVCVCVRSSVFPGGGECDGSWRRGSQNFPFTSFPVQTSGYPLFLSSVIQLQMTRAPLKHTFGLSQSNSPICKPSFETQYEDFSVFGHFCSFSVPKISRLSKSSRDVRLYFLGNFFWLSLSKWKGEKMVCFPWLSPFPALFSICKRTFGHGVAPEDHLPRDLCSFCSRGGLRSQVTTWWQGVLPKLHFGPLCWKPVVAPCQFLWHSSVLTAASTRTQSSTEWCSHFLDFSIHS